VRIQRGLIKSAPMIDYVKRIREHFADSARLKLDAADELAPEIARGAGVMTECLLTDGKILACGNGGSAADAQHFATELVGRFERERPGMPAIALTTDTSALTAIANDYDFDRVFSKHVEALGVKGAIVECGVWRGGSAMCCALALRARRVRQRLRLAPPRGSCAAES